MTQIIRAFLHCMLAATHCGCDRNVVEERASAIHERNARLDQVSKIRVMQEVRKRWAISGSIWLGKLPDGSVLRLEAPDVVIDPVKAGKPFCCNWLGQVTITANRWQSRPVSGFRTPLVMKYRALMESAERYSLATTMGAEVVPPSREEIAAFQSAPITEH